MKEVWKNMDVPPSPVYTPEEVLKTFQIAEGFKLELAASEPLIVDPVQIVWDPDGRMWAVEMRGYMPNVDGKGEDVRNGQIVVLEDLADDG
ncbi:MAG: dehydrogenase, partial [Planctomycetota bacterium]|nr:dehydrogenase [Planctomycetota bacterium]